VPVPVRTWLVPALLPFSLTADINAEHLRESRFTDGLGHEALKLCAPYTFAPQHGDHNAVWYHLFCQESSVVSGAQEFGGSEAVVVKPDMLATKGFLPRAVFNRLISVLNQCAQLLSKKQSPMSQTQLQVPMGVHCLYVDLVPSICAIRVEVHQDFTTPMLFLMRSKIDRIIRSSFENRLHTSVLIPWDGSHLFRLDALQCLTEHGDIDLDLDLGIPGSTVDSRTIMQRFSRFLLQPRELGSKWAHEDTYFDVMISYRQKANSDFAKYTWGALKQLFVGRRALRPFLDSQCLAKGLQFDVEFCRAITRTTVAVPIISVEALAGQALCTDPRGEKDIDYLLLEWCLFLELKENQSDTHVRLRSVMPIVLGGMWANGGAGFAPNICSLPASTFKPNAVHKASPEGTQKPMGAPEADKKACNSTQTGLTSSPADPLATGTSANGSGASLKPPQSPTTPKGAGAMPPPQLQTSTQSSSTHIPVGATTPAIHSITDVLHWVEENVPDEVHEATFKQLEHLMSGSLHFSSKPTRRPSRYVLRELLHFQTDLVAFAKQCSAEPDWNLFDHISKSLQEQASIYVCVCAYVLVCVCVCV
jgi:hypothetical protein